MRFVLGPNDGLKVDPNFLLAWKFGAPLPIIYVLVIEQKWGVEHHGGGGCYLDMPKGEIPYEETSLRKYCVVK